jgi:hypothetical protein
MWLIRSRFGSFKNTETSFASISKTVFLQNPRDRPLVKTMANYIGDNSEYIVSASPPPMKINGYTPLEREANVFHELNSALYCVAYTQCNAI